MPNHKKEAEILLKDLVGQIAAVTDSQLFKQAHGFTLEEYLKNRDEFSQICRKHAEHIEKVVRETGIAKTTGGAVGIASGTAAVAGIILAPFTAGLSLALTAGAAAGGVASAATTFSAAIVKSENIKSDKNQIDSALKKFEGQEKVVVGLLQKMNKNFQRLHQLMDKDPSVVELVMGYVTGIKEVGFDIIYGGVEGVKAAAVLAVLRTLGLILEASDRTAIAAGMAAPGLSLFGKTLIVAGSTTAKLLSGALGAIGVGFGIYDVVEGSKDIQGSQLANTYRQFLDTYSKDTTEIRNQLRELKAMVTKNVTS